jgi:hypothetical protein
MDPKLIKELYDIARPAGLPPLKKDPTPEQLIIFKDLFGRVPQEKLGKAFDISVKTVRRWAKEAGLVGR